MTATIIYQGQLRCQATHLASQTILDTDAPVDNRGKGERFSPTDLLCISLATCIVTTIAIKAMDMNIDMANTTMEVTKYMVAEPRRVGKIEINLQFSPSLGLDKKQQTILERVGNNCPVKRSLHTDVEVSLQYSW